MDFEDVIAKIGGYGRFQKILVWCYLVPASMMIPGYVVNQIFMLSVPKHSCSVPDMAETFNLTGGDSALLQRALVSKDNCRMYPIQALNSSVVRRVLENISSENFTQVPLEGLQRVACTRFTYDKTNYDSTAATKWNLVCDRAHLPSMVFTLSTLGMATGTLFFGAMSDRIGRRYTFFMVVVVAILSGIGSVLMTHFVAFAVLRFLNATIMPQIYQLPYIILLELVGPKQRTLMLGLSTLSWTMGLCILPGIAYITRSWVLLGLITAGAAISNLFYWKFLPESPRWLLSQDRLPETLTILERIAKVNGVQLPPDLNMDLKKVQKKIVEENIIAASSQADLIRKPGIRKKFFIVVVSWVANVCAYHGLHINVTNMSGNEFLNFFLLGLVEFPATAAAWWGMDWFGRRWTNSAFQMMVSLACVASCVIPRGNVLSIVASLVAKFACSAAFMILYQQAAELMPTPLRSFSMGASASVASIIGISVPYIIYLGRYGNWIPFLFLAVLSCVASVSSLWLPETNGFALSQTVEDAIEFGKGQAFFSFNRVKKPKNSGDPLDVKPKIPDLAKEEGKT